MKREEYIEQARQGLRMPIATHLVLAEQPDPEACKTDGDRLGHVIIETARRYNTPFAFPLMDLAVEKRDMLTLMGVEPERIDTFHFDDPPPPDALENLRAAMESRVDPQLLVYADAIRRVSREDGLLPIGMAIGPFSLMTKLIADPITGLYLAGSGLTGEEEPEVAAIEACIELAAEVILRSMRLQLDAGARAICVCEPAANLVYLSPHQLAAGADTFERFVMAPNRRLKALLAERGAELIFHDCGELTDDMVRDFCTLDPAILSLGSSRKLWEDTAIVPDNIVLFGNLPTKKFYSDSELPIERVRDMIRELAEKMKATGHPFILASECDVLCVPESDATIRAKVQAIME